MTRLTREQAAILGAATGVLCGPFEDMHEYIERIMERPVWTHELGDKDTFAEIKEKAKPDLIKIAAKEGDTNG